jgi:hypothetical protein
VGRKKNRKKKKERNLINGCGLSSNRPKPQRHQLQWQRSSEQKTNCVGAEKQMEK